MTLMSHLLVAAVLDERGQAYWDCTAPVSELKECIFLKFRDELSIGVTDISKILKKCTLQTFLIIGVEIGSPQLLQYKLE